MPASEVDPSRPLYRYGVDSLVALEVRNWITRQMKANMALLEILAAIPIEGFAGKIAEKSKLVTGLENEAAGSVLHFQNPSTYPKSLSPSKYESSCLWFPPIRPLIVRDDQMRRMIIPASDLAHEVALASVLGFLFEVSFGFVEDGDDVVVIELAVQFEEDDSSAGAGDSVGVRVDVFGASPDSGAV
ncbi:MAG: hypothetical protein LQ343_006819 [Gyalolechia ehrenbergii]|nr:MAG: hypothetical protein LQ343_006819 [Gyalolechia ehrenbergii]